MDELGTESGAVMRPRGRLADSIEGWGDPAVRSPDVCDLERAFSRFVKICVTIATPSFPASGIVRGAGRSHNILKLESFHPSTMYFTANAYFSTGSISGLYASIPLIAMGRINSR